MKSIEFKNFRKFLKFPELKFNDITLMVGKNNSGKSTLVKAILLVIDYLKNQQNEYFSFSGGNIKDVNIVSFDRARCKNQPEDAIYFNTQISSYIVDIKLSGDDKSINGNVEEIHINDIQKGIHFTINYTSQYIEATKLRDSKSKLNDTVSNINERLKLIALEFEKLKKNNVDTSNPEFLKRIDELNRERNSLVHAQANTTEQHLNNVYSLNYNIDLHRNPSNSNFIDYVREFLNENENEKRTLINLREKQELTDEQSEQFESVNALLSAASELNNSIEGFVRAVESHYYYYWSAETQKQSALFSIRDEGNALAKAIHDFSKMKILPGEDEWLFVVNEMHDFEIGERFELISHAGEAYECNIIEENECFVSLADKGMGTIQLMTLLFRLATIIRQQNKHKENITLIIEEPELNLHPRLQSKLASLFEKINNYYGVKFVIETHSEYMIRQSQVIVNQANYRDNKDLDNNRFSTYYFNLDRDPYLMHYRTDGKFSNEFGTGFFDEANKLIFEIL